MRELIPDLIDIGVDILNPVQVSAANMDTGELKREFGRELVPRNVPAANILAMHTALREADGG